MLGSVVLLGLKPCWLKDTRLELVFGLCTLPAFSAPALLQQLMARLSLRDCKPMKSKHAQRQWY